MELKQDQIWAWKLLKNESEEEIMALKKVQIQLLNEETGEVIEDVTPLTEAESVVYSNPTPTVSPHGGIPAGSTFDNVSVKKMLDDILYPYTKPTISFSASPAGGVREKGTTLDEITLTANITKKSENIKKVEFLKDSAVIGTVDAPKAGGGTETYAYEQPINANCQLKARVTDAKDGTVDSSAQSYTFVYPLYIGSLDASASSPTQDQIKALEKKVVTKGTQKYTYTIDNKRMCIACPPGWTLSKIVDPNGFDVTSSFAKKTVSVTGLDGTAQSYTVYVSEPTTQSGFAVTFNV